MNTICIAYVPVLHEGYRRFFEKYKGATLYVLGTEVIGEFKHLYKEIRQLDPALVKKAVESWGIFSQVEILDLATLKTLATKESDFVLPKEDIMEELADKYLTGKKVEYNSIFLRMDKHKAMEEKPVEADQKISRDQFDRNVVAKLKGEAEKSSDWYRRIGAAVIKNGEIILTNHNKHLPSDHTPYIDGDPRINFHKGIGIEYSTAIHAEAGVIAEAAKKGISLEGADMYVTIFPCPPCAKQVAFSGIKRLFYSGGYSVLDQEKILKGQGVEIIYVEM